MKKNQIKELVKQTYTKVLQERSSCCSPNCCDIDTATDFSGEYEKIEGYVPAADYKLGCGIPTDHARLFEGATVLDLGSGAGNDVFVARHFVGESGYVIGVDMTEAMIAQANKNKAALGYSNVEFRLGEIEALPVDDNSIDIVLSNCVMNLVPDKEKAYQEAFRVLKPGGHFSISDIVIRGELPKEIQEAAALYAGCVAGAMAKDAYLSVIRKAGFTAIEVPIEQVIELPDSLLKRHLPADKLADFRASGVQVVSITVYAAKPA